ncbi:hypothetical protein UlMin_021415 [Ulmus minor]
MEKPTHIAILPCPGMGHLIPLVELAKRLIVHHNLAVTFIVPTIGSPSKPLKQVLQTLPAGADVVYLPPVSVDGETTSVKPEAHVSLAIKLSLSPLREVIKSLKASSKLVALVLDPFGADAFGVAKEFGILSYIFFLVSATALCFSFELPNLDKTVLGEFRDMKEPLKLPGCVPVQGRDLMDPVQDRSDDAYKMVLNQSKSFFFVDGIILNSFLELEEGAIQALLKEEPGKPAVYPVGPLIRIGMINPVEESCECLNWLDNQPSKSVLFVSFGSGGTLSYDQTKEIALGLELSGQRFLWVLRSPNNEKSNASFLSAESFGDPFPFLPKGFLERVKGRGLVVSSWAPQAQVLSHGSTGGFLSHCGWNSILESVVHGVPLIAWPLYAEQKMNAVIVTESVKVALRPKESGNGVVSCEEVSRVVGSLMEGEEGKRIRKRMEEFKEAAAKTALGEDGCSSTALSKLVGIWKKRSSSCS